MTMTLAQQAVSAVDAAFIPVVQQAMIKVAQDIAAESTATNGHAARYAFAQAVLRAPEVYAPILAKGVVADSITDKTATDTAIYNRLSSIWNGYAGA